MTDRFFQERLEKLEKIKALGFHPYPEHFERSHFSTKALEEGEKKELRNAEEVMETTKNKLTVAGRLMAFRSFGKLTFGKIQDDQGRIQVCFVKGNLDENEEKLLKLLDIGDHIGVSGELFKTKHGETTVLAAKLHFLGKSLRPLPEKFHGLQDQEAKYRQRYLDLMMDPESRKRFDLRSQIIRKLREFYWKQNFTEIETPVLENVSSGAAAKPFTTHHNALDMEVYLRIAGGELWQKEAIVGGYEKIFEIGHCFRNEGMDPSHLQEFTMVEHYAAYWNYEDNMKFTEEMFEFLMKEVMGTTKVEVLDREGNAVEVDFKTPWPRKNYAQMIEADCGINILDYDNENDLLNAIKEKKIVIEKAETMGYGNLVDHLYKKVSRPKLIQPTFVIKHPADTKPLARRNDEDPRICDTFQLLVNTWEVVNAYSELVDPVDQRNRLEKQAAAKAGGDEDAMSMNEEYLKAMEYGMPPISGWGMGIDRLVTLLSKQDNLRDVVMFPLLKPEK
jgi:lysyl-tRNA synthetase class 2